MTQHEQDLSSDTPEASSVEDPSTLAPDGSLVATAQESTTTSSANSTLRGMNLDSLSPRSQAIRFLLADEMSDGFNLNTLARELGLSPSSASALLMELKNELELQTGPVPQLTPDEFEALKESIAEDGVRVPVIIGEHTLIDGRHRWRASKELGLKEIPAIFLSGLTEEQERDACIQINAIRRHLTREQKRALVRSELMHHPTRSSRQIASVCGVHHTTVETLRQEMRKESQVAPTPEAVAAVREFVHETVEAPEKRVGASGHVYEVPARPEPPVEKPLGFVNCGRCGQRHLLVRDGGGYRLESV